MHELVSKFRGTKISLTSNSTFHKHFLPKIYFVYLKDSGTVREGGKIGGMEKRENL